MSLILRYPAGPLILPSNEVFNNEVKSLCKSLNAVIEKALSSGQFKSIAGLAAPQIGINKRIFIARIGGESKFFINPEYITKSKDVSDKTERCLSILESHLVPRSEMIRLSWMDANNKEHISDFHGWQAEVIQHEMDHLDGRLIINYLDA